MVAVCASPCLPQSSELKDAIAASDAAAGANRWPEAEEYARRAVELASSSGKSFALHTSTTLADSEDDWRYGIPKSVFQ